MKRNGVVALIALLVAGFICQPAAAQSVPTAKSSIVEPTQKSRVAENYGRLPLSFESNHGQTDLRVKFISRGAGQTLFLTSNEAVLALSKPIDQKPDSPGFPNLSISHSLRTTLLRMRLLGANPLSEVTGLEALPGTSNYFIGNDPARWRTNVPTYGKVRYSQIYPGIDLVYYGNQRQLEYDFVVAPGGDPAQIRLAIRGASKLSIDADGSAVVRWKDGDVRLLKPRLYQEVRGEKIEIAGGYALQGNELLFVVAPYDHSQKLVIDPVLVYSTYLGGINSDGASGVAVDSAGNAYVVGTTSYTGFPVTSGVVQPTNQGTTNAFVAKLNAAGTALLYSTYLGGNGQDTGYAISVDSSGSAYVTGATFASNFPITSGAFQTTTKPVATPGSTVFVTKLSPDGSSLAYSTYLGGSANDTGFAIAVDASGSAYVAGETQSGNFPVRGTSPKVVGGPISCDSMNSGGSYDGFITKFSPGGDTVAYSLYLGGSGTDVATGVAVDSSGNAYVAGYTTSKDFLVFNTCPGPGPGPTSLQPANAGADNGFIVKVSPDGLAFLGATYLGGSGQDAITSIAVDSSGFVYLAGEGNSGGAGGLDAIGAKLNGSLDTSSKVYFNYIGGSGFDRATGVAVDSAGNEYLVGQTASTNFPQVSPIQPAFGGGTYDAFVTELSPSGSIVYSTYLGGSGDESTSIGGGPIAVDASGNVYVVGSTTSTNFPGVSSSSIQPANGGGSDAFIVKLGPSAAPTVTALVASVNPSVFGQQVSFTVTVSPSSSSSLTPSGNVTISDGSITLGTMALTSASAIFNTLTLAPGNHSITASYGGDSNFSASTSTPLPQVVNQGTTTTSASASPNSGIVGQAVTLTATVSPVAPAAGTPTGTVTFLDGATSLGTGTLSGGQATLATSLLASGTHSITVTYAGDSNFLGSTSSAASITIQQTTTTTLIVAPNPANAGQLVTLTATVAGSSGAPTGELVTFLDGATVLGTGTLSAGGTATFTTPSLAAGNHSLSASYPGDASFAPSTSSTVPLTVVPPPVVITDNESITVTDTTSFPDVFEAEVVKVTDQVTVYAFFPIAISPTPPILSAVANQPYSGVTFTGTRGYQNLTLSEFGVVPGMSFAIAGASATLSGTPPQAGTFPFTITATDSIGNKFSQNYSLMVSATCPAISVSPSGSLGVVTAGTAFSQTFIASGGVGTTAWSTTSTLPLAINFVGGVLSGIPTQSGTFAVTITATDQSGCQGSSNVSLLVVPAPAVITDNETITVSDNVSFPDVFDSESVKVTDQVFIQVISPTTTSISAPGVIYGTPAAVTVSVSSAYGTVSGNVTLSVDRGTPTTMALSSGSAVFNAGILTPGTHSLAASFPAQGNFLASSTTGAVFVSQPPAFTSTNATTFTVGAAGTFGVATAGVPFPALTISSGTLPSGVTFTNNLNGTGTLAGVPAPGTGAIYPLTISASNGVGAPVLQSFTLTVDQAPTITSGSSTTFTEGVPGSFTLTSTGFPISALSESPTPPAGLNFFDNGDGTATLSGTPADGTQGSYVITLTAANGVGTNATQNFTLTINQGLAITSGSGTTFTEQMPGSFLVTTMGFPVASLSETGPLPTGVTFTDNHDGTASLAGTPAVGASNIYPITITANNGVGAPTTQAFTLTVNSTAAITSGSTTTFTVGSAGFFSITTMGTPAPSLTFTGTLPTGVSFADNGNGTATLSGTPAAGAANSYPLAITANNGVGTAAVQNFTLVVNQGAAILSGNSTTFTAGVAGTFTVMTSGSPTPTLTETPSLLPTGVKFVDNGNGTATLSGTPAAGTGGTYPITITANNGVDLPAVQTFTLNINQNPAITSSNMVTFSELVMGSFTVTSAGNPLPTLTEVGNLPNGVTFTNNGDGTAFLGGVPAAGSAGQYGFTITAANGVLPSATQTFTLTVTPDLSFISSNSTSFIMGVLSQFTIRTAGTPPPTLTYSGVLPAGVTFTAGANGTATLGGSAQAGTEGTYPITFTAVNGTGASATQPFILTIQPPGESAPVITSANHATFVLGLLAGDGVSNPYNFFRVTTTGFPVPALTVTGLPASSFRDNHDGTATIAFTPTATGTKRFRITATGPLGLTAAQNFTLTTVVLGAAPMFTSANQVGFMTGVPNSFTIAAGPYVDQIVVTAGSTLPAGLILTDNHNGTATLSGTLVGAGQTLSLQFTASNPSLNPAVRTTPYTATQTFSLAVLPRGDTAPVITSANHATFAMGLLAGDGVSNPYNFFKVTTTGLPVPKLTAKYIVNGVAAGTVPYLHDNGDGTATIAFAPPGAGTQTFTITATGPLGLTATQIFTLQIVSLGTAPKFTSVKQVGFTAGVPNSFTVAAGPFVDQIAVTAGALPSGLTFTDNHNGTATLSGTVPVTGSFVGNDSITLTAKNPNVNTAVQAAYTATQAFTISVLPPGYFAPVITSPDNATFYYGLGAGVPNDPINYFKVTTTGFPAPKLTAKHIVNGVAVGTVFGFIDNGDGTASIAFKPGAVGTERFMIIATGPLGLTATQVLTLNVVYVPPLKFTSANQVGFTAGVPNSFTVTAGPFVYQIAVTAGVLPSGVTLTDNHNGTATLSGIPLVGGQEWPLQFTATNVRRFIVIQAFTLAVLP